MCLFLPFFGKNDILKVEHDKEESNLNKIYVLDTNILLLDPKSILAFEDRNIIIPLKVIEELDKKKTMVGEIGYNARKLSAF